MKRHSVLLTVLLVILSIVYLANHNWSPTRITDREAIPAEKTLDGDRPLTTTMEYPSTDTDTTQMIPVNTRVDETHVSDPMQKITANGESAKKSDSASPTIMNESRYLSYTPELFALHANTKRVLFFYAAWCPTCQPTDKEFTLEQANIPGDVILFRTDYDHETELKTKYGVTYQHTFVYLNSDGNALSTWNGGGMKELIDHTQSP